MGKPNFLIIGETKCGTTSMFNYLVKHPQVLNTYGNGENYDAIYSTKEIRFFDRYYDRGIDWYFSCFPERQNGEVTGEATPMYMFRTLAAQRIKKHLPEVKLIVLLRNPVDRLISNYQHNFKWVPGWQKLYPTLEQYFFTCSDRDYYLIEKGIYYLSLRKWLDYFPRKQFCVVKSEDMFTAPQKALQRITRFLDIRDYSLDEYPKLRANSYEDPNFQLKKELEDFYKPYNERLESLLDQNFGWYE